MPSEYFLFVYIHHLCHFYTSRLYIKPCMWSTCIYGRLRVERDQGLLPGGGTALDPREAWTPAVVQSTRPWQGGCADSWPKTVSTLGVLFFTPNWIRLSRESCYPVCVERKNKLGKSSQKKNFPPSDLIKFCDRNLNFWSGVSQAFKPPYWFESPSVIFFPRRTYNIKQVFDIWISLFKQHIKQNLLCPL